MKIVFIASRSIDEIGGIESYMKNLLPKLVKIGYEVILYTEGRKFNHKEFEGVAIIEIPSIKGKFFNKILIGILSTVHSVLFNRNVDIYHYNANAAALLSFMPKLTGHTVVYQGHGLEWKRAKWSGFAQTVIQYLDHFVIWVNDNITMVSYEQSEYIQENYNKKSTTIHSGVDVDTRIYDINMLEKYNLAHNEYILYLGRLVPEKKANILIDAFCMLNIENLKLVIAGDDPNEHEYIENLKGKAIKNKSILFLGAVYGDEKNVLLQNCKIFCIPSELEGLPITLLEAMSYKRLCIASDIRANIEALDECGLYFETNNSEDLSQTILSAINNIESYENMRENAKQRIIEKFTWDTIAKQFNDYYKSIAKTNINSI